MLDTTVNQLSVASASLLNDVTDRFRGHVDIFNLDRGITGWAIDFAAPETAILVELIMGDEIIATATTGIVRNDIADILALTIKPGFAFNPDAFEKLRHLARVERSARPQIRIAGTALVLPAGHGIPTLGDLFADETRAAAPAANLDLAVRLSAHLADASKLAAKPLRPLPENVVGFIEAFAIDEAGTIWLAGWRRRGATTDCPAVIVDRQKIPAGFAFALFDRPDLSPNCSGIIGALFTTWRPNPGAEILIYLDSSGTNYLRVIESVPVIPMQQFLESYFEKLRASHTGHTLSLQRWLTRAESWAISGDSIGFPAAAAIDEVFILPGFGALAAGWALSPLKRIAGLTLRMGNAILPADEHSLSFRPRPDLAHIFPGNAQLLQTAGFVAAFRGALSDTEIINPVLKVLYADGSTSNHAIEPKSLHRIGRSVSLAAATSLFPALTAERFFPAFAAALRRDTAAAIDPPRPYLVTPATHALVFVVPEDRSDMFLLLSTIGTAIKSHSDPPGIILVAASNHNRADLLALLAALRAQTPVAFSLFFIAETAYALYTLPEILAAAGTTAFAFVGPGLVLAAAGWQAIFAALAQPRPPLAMLEIDDTAAPSQTSIVSAACFIWNARAFAAWIATLPIAIGGFSGLIDQTGAVQIHPRAARLARRPATPPLIDAINRVPAEAYA